jgi:hypothetical protein
MSTLSGFPAWSRLQRSRARFAVRALLLAGVSIACAATLGCSSSPATNNNDGASAGGAVVGAADTHCTGVAPIVVNALSCAVPAPTDGGVTPADAGGPPEMAATLFNAEGDDDDCKYHVKFSATPAVTPNANLTFKLTLTKKADGSPATRAIDAQGNGVAIEAYLDSNHFHVAPNTTPPTMTTESPADSGVYTITPVKLDASGRWIVRFHLYETCTDALPDSPHGHVAFFFDVP